MKNMKLLIISFLFYVSTPPCFFYFIFCLQSIEMFIWAHFIHFLFSIRENERIVSSWWRIYTKLRDERLFIFNINREKWARFAVKPVNSPTNGIIIVNSLTYIFFEKKMSTVDAECREIGRCHRNLHRYEENYIEHLFLAEHVTVKLDNSKISVFAVQLNHETMARVVNADWIVKSEKKRVHCQYFQCYISLCGAVFKKSESNEQYFFPFYLLATFTCITCHKLSVYTVYEEELDGT